MATLADMIARIGSELARPDLLLGTTPNNAPKIRAAIATAISEYQSQRFRFSDIDPANPPQWSTVAGRWIYDATDNQYIGTIYKFDYLNLVIGSTLERLEQVTPEEIHLDNQQYQQNGQPDEWAYEGNKIIIYPIPDQAWTLIMGGHIRIAAPASDTEADNPWMNDGELMIRSRAKYELAVHVLRNPTMAASMSPEPDGDNGRPGQTYRAWRTLKGQTNKITGLGKIRPMRF